MLATPAAAVAGVYGYRWLTDDRPRLAVMGDERGIVYLRPIDIERDLVGSAINQGTVKKWRGTRVDPGYYRIVIVVPGVGFSEATRYLSRGEDKVVDANIRPTVEVTEQGKYGEMVLIPSGEETVAMLQEPLSDYQRRIQLLNAFWIDKTEVSNKRYRAFLDDSGHPPPKFWGNRYPPNKQNGKYPKDDWDDLPVVGVTFIDAQAFAEWAGKRLPTYLEWIRAARGPAEHLFPWGNEGSGDPELLRSWSNSSINQPEAMKRARDDPDQRRRYSDHTLPVGDEGNRDKTPDGLLHMFGNVSEWTESMTISGSPIGDPSPNQRIIAGRAWGDYGGFKIDLSTLADDPVDQNLLSRGFRCAKSIYRGVIP